MIFVWGKRFYGKVEALDDACVRTYFFHLFFLPVLPRASVLMFAQDGKPAALRLPLDGRSILAAYARMWSLPALYAGIAISSEGALLPGVLLAVAAGVTALWAWLFAGRLSAAEQGQRRAYAAFAGAPVDVALLARAADGPDRDAAASWLAGTRARAEAAFAEAAVNPQASYREVARVVDWRAAAQAQAATPECRRAALTLARIATAQGDAAARAQAAQAHAALWAALSQPAAAEVARAA
jgi:hypothetical protein